MRYAQELESLFKETLEALDRGPEGKGEYSQFNDRPDMEYRSRRVET